MSATIACIAGEEIHRQWEGGRIEGERLGRRSTPFGDSGEVFRVHAEEVSYYLLPRHGQHLAKTAPARVPDRANLYALKDLGVERVLAWGPGGAITHNIAVGDLVILDDLIDRTYLRERTFFELSPLGYLRQFPVFCPHLRQVLAAALEEMKLLHHPTGTAAVSEGPRLETPAEVRMLGTIGAEVVTHNFVPEVFLAKELQLCYAAVCYVVNFAETGSRHRPFAPGSLFGPPSEKTDGERLAGVVGALSQIVGSVAGAVGHDPRPCECGQTMAAHVRQYDLPADWRQWFETP
ncbi:MAG TPA: MTAP family purine nucleoside phosphorylase [Phycisphaerae bacterium]|nr:MTAP family purine nucleoside phosphorylase [Phycisphaerae bacterium]